MVAVDGVVFFQVLDAAKAAYEVSDLYIAHHGALDHQPAHRHGLDGPRRDPVQARRDQRPAARRGRPGDRAVGRQDHPRRAQGHPPAAGHRQRDDPADEGRAREARRRSSKPKASRQSAILRAEGEKQSRDPSGRRRSAKPRSARPRRASARPRPKPTATKAVSDAIEGGSGQAINYFIAQKYVEAVGEFATLAQRQDDPVPGRGDPADRHARRDRRARQGSVRRWQPAAPPRQARKAVAERA